MLDVASSSDSRSCLLLQEEEERQAQRTEDIRSGAIPIEELTGKRLRQNAATRAGLVRSVFDTASTYR